MDVSVYYRSGGGRETHRIDVHGFEPETAIEMVQNAVAEESGGRKAPGQALYQRPFLARVEGSK